MDIENVGIVERVDNVENIEDVEHLGRFMVQFIRADKIIEIKLFIKFYSASNHLMASSDYLGSILDWPIQLLSQNRKSTHQDQS